MPMNKDNARLAQRFFARKDDGTPIRRSKAECLQFIKELSERDDYIDPMLPKLSSGSSYGGDGIRISGSPEFVTAVLSHLKDVLILENREFRIDLAHTPVQNVKSDSFEKTFQHTDGHVMYIAYSERGACYGSEFIEDSTEEFYDRKPGLREAKRQGLYQVYRFFGMSHEDAKKRADEATKRKKR